MQHRPGPVAAPDEGRPDRPRHRASCPRPRRQSLGATYGSTRASSTSARPPASIYLALNTRGHRPTTLAVRKAIELGHRPACAAPHPRQVRRRRTDQILVPGHPGLQAVQDLRVRRRERGEGEVDRRQCTIEPATLNVIHRRARPGLAQAQSIEYNLKQMGLNHNDVPTPGTVYYNVARDEGNIVQHRACRLVRRLLRPVRLHQRAARRADRFRRTTTSNLAYLNCADARQADGSQLLHSQERLARTRTRSST